MKPRSAVATYIVAQLAAIRAEDVHKHAEKFKIKPPPLKKKEKARVEAILNFYRGKIAEALATTSFEGDYAEVPGHDPLPKDGTTTSTASAQPTSDTASDTASGTTDGLQAEAASRIHDAAGIVFGALLGGGTPVNITVNIGDVTIGDVTSNNGDDS